LIRSRLKICSTLVVVSLAVCAGSIPAGAQDQKEPESGKSEPGAKPPAPPPPPPSGTAAAGTATAPKGQASGKSGSTASSSQQKKSKTPAAPSTGEVGMEPAEAAAGTLRTPGELVSQSGDLKIQVESNYFSEFPGFDLSGFPAEQKKAILDQANTVFCTCGCRGETVAKCVVLDPSCGTARGMLQKMIDAVKAAPPATPSAGANKKP
jgi:hypothetical protein